ncbi:MAG: DUF1330 domain-containing protein [Candidatus Azotimanducaceae bacterium]
MTCYILAEIQIDDRGRYADYESGFLAILTAYEGQVIAVDEARTLLEGQAFGHRTVILKFASEVAALNWYESEAYQKLMTHRQAASQANVSIIHGLD